METLGKIIFSIGLSISSFFGFHQPEVQTPLGAFTPVQASQFTLSGAGITSSATTIQLTSFTLPDPARTLITMSMFGDVGYAVIEPQTSKIETITFTGVTQNANGTALLTGVTRGIDFVSPYAGSASRALSHAGGSYLILSNPAAFYGQQFVFKNQIGTSTAVLIFSSTTPPRLDSVAAQAAGTYIATTSEFASIAYVNTVAVAGCSTSSTVVTGCIRLGTALQQASTTFTAGTPTALYTANSTSTPRRGCEGSAVPGSLCTVIAQNDGKISPFFIASSSDYFYNWGATMMFNSSTTANATTSLSASNVLSKALILNNIPYAFPSTQGASSSVLTNNGSGSLVWMPPSSRQYSYSTTTTFQLDTANGFATSSPYNTSFVIPANVLTASSTIQFKGNFFCKNSANGDQNCLIFLKDIGGATITTIDVNTDNATDQEYAFDVMITSNGISASNQIGIGSAVNYSTLRTSSTVNGGTSVATTGTFNLAAGISLVVVQRSTGANTSVNIKNYSIVVNP